MNTDSDRTAVFRPGSEPEMFFVYLLNQKNVYDSCEEQQIFPFLAELGFCLWF